MTDEFPEWLKHKTSRSPAERRARYYKEKQCGPNQIKEYQIGFPRPVLIVETGEAFASVTACARHIGGFSSAIHNVLSGRRRTHKGFTFKVLTDKEYKVYRSA